MNQRDESDIENTEQGFVDITFTHRENGSPIGVFELYDSIPIKKSPPELQEKLKLKKMKR